MRRVEFNFARGIRDVRLFELGTVFFPGNAGKAPREEAHLAIALTGDQAPLHWTGEPKGVDLWYLKGLLTRLLPGARLEGAQLEENAPVERGVIPEEGFVVRGTDGEDHVLADVQVRHIQSMCSNGEHVSNTVGEVVKARRE